MQREIRCFKMLSVCNKTLFQVAMKALRERNTIEELQYKFLETICVLTEDAKSLMDQKGP